MAASASTACDPSGVRRLAAAAALLLGLTGLAGCASGPSATSYQSGDIHQLYADAMIRSGRFREEARPPDAPFDNEDLARNFLKVAFDPEEQLAEIYARKSEPQRLTRWEGPIGYSLEGGGVQPGDRRLVSAIATDLARHSGLRIQEVAASQSNISIIVLEPSERAQLGATFSRASWYRDSLLRDWVETFTVPCFGRLIADPARGNVVEEATIFVKAELTGAFRRGCFLEEMTQSLGLLFDHEDVRPSIFNDDQEFIGLTDHDRRLLEILYDPALRAGMTRGEAEPVVERLLQVSGDF